MRPKVLAGRVAGFLALFTGGLLALHFVVGDAPPPQDADLRPVLVVARPGNAQPDFVALTEAVKLTGGEREYLKRQLEAGVTDQAGVDRLLARSTEVLELFARFSKRSHFEDPLYRDPSKIDYTTPIPQFFPIVTGAHLVALRGERALEAGRADAALKDALMIADAAQLFLGSRQPLIISLVGFLLSDVASRGVHRAAAGGRLGAAELKDAAARLSRLDDGAAALAAGLRYEYVSGANMLKDLPRYEQAGERLPWRKLSAKHRFFYQPNATQALFEGRFRPVIEQADKPCLEAKVPEFQPVTLLGANVVGKTIFNVAMPSYEKLYTRRCQSQFLRTAAAVEAAYAAFRLEKGRAPRGLAELGAYVDPFTGKEPAFAPETGRISTPGRTTEGKEIGF